MTALGRRVADPLVAILAIMFTLFAVACGPSGAAAPSSSPSPTPTTAQPSLTPVPGGAGVGPTVAPTLPSTTQTAFGLIWDGLPSSFPKLPGEEPALTEGSPTSGAFAVNMDAAAASRAIDAELKAAGWTVDIGSPLEDGSVVLDATGARTGCKSEVRFTPSSGTIIMSVLYGAACPFS